MSSLFRNRSSKSPRELVRSLKTNIAVVSDDESSDKKKDKVSLWYFLNCKNCSTFILLIFNKQKKMFFTI